MFSSLSKLFHTPSSTEPIKTALRNLTFEGPFCNFYIDFDSSDTANSMMFFILNMEHKKTVHTIMRIEKTSLSVSIQHNIDADHDSVIDFVDKIDRKAVEVINGKIHRK
jgi:hypothetical protein